MIKSGLSLAAALEVYGWIVIGLSEIWAGIAACIHRPTHPTSFFNVMYDFVQYTAGNLAKVHQGFHHDLIFFQKITIYRIERWLFVWSLIAARSTTTDDVHFPQCISAVSLRKIKKYFDAV
jgi:hypothetical protein